MCQAALLSPLSQSAALFGNKWSTLLRCTVFTRRDKSDKINWPVGNRGWQWISSNSYFSGSNHLYWALFKVYPKGVFYLWGTVNHYVQSQVASVDGEKWKIFRLQGLENRFHLWSPPFARWQETPSTGCTRHTALQGCGMTNTHAWPVM